MDRRNRAINQPAPLAPYDAFRSDTALQEALELWAGRAALDGAGGKRLAEIGEAAGSERVREWAFAANRNAPRLVGDNEVEFDPAWYELLSRAVGWGLHGTPWTSGEPAAHAVRAAGFYLWSQAEAGHGCPISMTYAAIPALRASTELAAEWIPRLSSTDDARPVLAGMGMTEVQGGSDVRGTTTVAEPTSDGGYRLDGHKWFFSAPMSDVFLVLAQAPGGLSCFVMPRLLPDGTRNAFSLVRLKDKLGNRSNASSEVEFEGAWARLLGEEGRGIATIIEMVSATRLDCVLGSAGVQRRAVTEAIWWASQREAFGRRLVDQPLMRNVLAELALEAEAATWLGVRLAAAVDNDERQLLRIALPAAKFLVCKRTPTVVAEALECTGGNGYVEDYGMPLLFRESPLNSIWEGSGSIQALDLLRALGRHPESLDAWLTEVGAARGEDPNLDHATEDVLAQLGDAADLESRARRLAERMTLVLQGALLVRHGPPHVAAAFCASKLGMDNCQTHGTLPAGHDLAAIIARTRFRA
jgi:putative acyl-CoA dehydrogenase